MKLNIFDCNNDFSPFLFNVTHTKYNNKLSECLEERNFQADKANSLHPISNISKLLVIFFEVGKLFKGIQAFLDSNYSGLLVYHGKTPLPIAKNLNVQK